MHGDYALNGPVATRRLDWNGLDPHGPKLEIGPDDIHLWVFDLRNFDPVLLDQWIQPAEYARAERILDQGKRVLYLGGRLGLRYLLTRYTGIANEALHFGYGSRGKPRLENKGVGDLPAFNYSLSQDKVLYAVSHSRQLGVDMELLPRTVAAEQMAYRHLTEIERRVWQNLPLSQRNDAMLCCWTRKEAYGKALGVGIRYQMNAVTLFHQLQQDTWQVERSGLFQPNETAGMAEKLEGVQLYLPFGGVASLMYGLEFNKITGTRLAAGQISI